MRSDTPSPRFPFAQLREPGFALQPNGHGPYRSERLFVVVFPLCIFQSKNTTTTKRTERMARAVRAHMVHTLDPQKAVLRSIAQDGFLIFR